MPKTRSPSVLGSGRILYLPTARIRPNPMQPRKHFDTGGLQELPWFFYHNISLCVNPFFPVYSQRS